MRLETHAGEVGQPWWEKAWELNKLELARPLLGMGFSGGERNNLFLSLAGEQFTSLAGLSGVDDPGDPQGFAVLDLDQDGCLDLALATRDRPGLQLFHDDLCRRSGRGSLAVRLVGGNRAAAPSTQWSARDAVGARVTVVADGRTLVRESHAGEGWRTQNSATLAFGLGAAERVERLVVRWPSGRERTVADVPAGSLLTVYEDASESPQGAGFELRPLRAVALREASAAAAPPSAHAPLAPDPEAELTLYTAMATWCPSCRRELPALGRLRAALADRVAFRGVSVDPEDDAAKLEAYRAEEEPPYELLSDLPADQRSAFHDFLLRSLGAEALPATLIVRRDGSTAYVSAGIPTLSKVRGLLR